MPWPEMTDYSEAVQNPQVCFRGTELESGLVAVNRRGMPLMFSGRFACVYSVEAASHKYAVRCFTLQVKDQQSRYNQLSEYLKDVLLPSFVDFKYLEKGILIRGNWYPIVRMEWVEGESLSNFVETNRHDSDALRRLAAQWRGGPVANLRGLRIAHNDLQHGNVMVQADGQIRLVDYDGIFLPQFQGQRSSELGHKNYQHPQRKADDYDDYVDNFPSLVIYLSLLALASEPGLWAYFNDDNLIFTRSDYADPAKSELFDVLKRSPDETVVKLAESLEECCAMPVADVPDLETLLQNAPRRTAPVPAAPAPLVTPSEPLPVAPPPQPAPPPRTAQPSAPTPSVAPSGQVRSTVPTASGNSYRQTLQARQQTPAAPLGRSAPAPPTVSQGGKSGGLKKAMLGVGAVAATVVTVFAMIVLSNSGAESGVAGDSGASGGGGMAGGGGVTGDGDASGGGMAGDSGASGGGVAGDGGASGGVAGGGGASGGVGVAGDSGASGGVGVAGGGGVAGDSGASGVPSQAPPTAGGETPPTVTLELSSSSISEKDGSSKVTASLSSPSSAMTTLTVSIAPGAGADSADYILSKPTLTIGAGSTTSADSLMVSAIDNATDAPDKTVSIYGDASNDLGAIDPAAVTLTITDDDAAPVVTLEFDSSSISENGGAANVAASLSHPSSQDVAIVVSAFPEPPATSGDFIVSSNNTLTIAAGSTHSAGVFTITGVDNGVDEPDKSVTVSATVSGGLGVNAPVSQTLTINDDDAMPTLTLELSPPSISENGGAANVVASLSGPSSQDVTIVVSASPVSPAVSGDFAITSNDTLTIEAGYTDSAGAVTIVGVDNSVDEPDKTVAVSAYVSGGLGVNTPASKRLTINDDDDAPTLTLELSPSYISENGEAASVTASLSGPSSQDVIIAVSASPEPPAVGGDFTISPNDILTIEAGSTQSTGTVAITGVDNSVDEPDKSITVSATVTEGRGVSDPSSQTLVITDDDAAPTVTLDLSTSSISENGGVAKVTASLSGLSAQDVTVVVSASPMSHAVSDDFAITSSSTLTIEAGSTQSTGTVTITGVDNSVDEPDKAVTVSATVSGYEVSDPSSLTLTITDDEATPVTLELSPSSISENGGVAYVTASLSVPSTKDVTVVVSASPESPAVSGDFAITSNDTLTIEAGSTQSTGVVTITGIDNSADGPDKSVTVSATASGHDVLASSSRTLTITDDDDAPTATIALSSYSISENGGTANVTASLSGPSSQDVTIVVSASPELPEGSGDFTITSNKTLTITAGSTRSTGTVTITGVDNSVDEPDKSVMVSAEVSGGQDMNAPSSLTLAITDDDATPTLTLELDSISISENGGATNITASLSGPSSQDVTIVVSASAVSPAVSGDFAITSNKTLTIEAGATDSTGVVTITGIDNSVDESNKTVRVSVTVSGGYEVSAPPSRTLTIRDDDAAPTLTLVLSSYSISENGGTVSVTASLSGPSSQNVTLEVTASAKPPAVSGDFTITSNKTLTITAGSTRSTGTVTITAVDNSVDEPDKSVFLWATVSDGPGVSVLPFQLLTITDDDATPTLTLVLSASSISENGGSASVTASLSSPSSQDVILAVSVSPISPAVSGDFTITSNNILTITAGSTDSTGTVTITGVDNSLDEPNKTFSVSATVSGGRVASDPPTQILTITDDDAPG